MTGDFPARLHHTVPAWVAPGSVFHVRIRAHPTQATPLTHIALAPRLLAAIRRQHDSAIWWCHLVVLMPDHLHALLSFPRQEAMSGVVRNWKRGAARLQGVRWQSNFFDHRIRSDRELDETWAYITNNPVAKGLAVKSEIWPWQWSPPSEKQ